MGLSPPVQGSGRVHVPTVGRTSGSVNTYLLGRVRGAPSGGVAAPSGTRPTAHRAMPRPASKVNPSSLKLLGWAGETQQVQGSCWVGPAKPSRFRVVAMIFEVARAIGAG